MSRLSTRPGSDKSNDSLPTALHGLAYLLGVAQAWNEDLTQSQREGYRAGRQNLHAIREQSSWPQRFSREVRDLPNS